jgi:hypothetical protein
MANLSDPTKSELKKLRDRLAIEAPRARTRSGVPADLARRLQAALELVGAVYLLPPSEALEEVGEDAVVEAHLVLHDWELCVEKEGERSRKQTGPHASRSERRVHARQDINVSVEVVRHAVSGGSSERAIVVRPARNVSRGGIMVALTAADLPGVAVGSVVRVAATLNSGSFEAKAAVVRRDAAGVGLRWVKDTPDVERLVQALVDAVARTYL